MHNLQFLNNKKNLVPRGIEKRSGSVHVNVDKINKPHPSNILINDHITAASTKGPNSINRKYVNKSMMRVSEPDSPKFKFDKMMRNNRKLDPLNFRGGANIKDGMYMTMQPGDLAEMLANKKDKTY